MRLESLYRVRFIYPEGWAINITGEQGSEGQHLYFAEGSVQGLSTGTSVPATFPAAALITHSHPTSTG